MCTMPKYEIKNVEGLENIKQYSDMAAIRISPSLMAIDKEEFDSRKKGAQVSFEDFNKYRNADTIVIKCAQIKKIPSSTFSIIIR